MAKQNSTSSAGSCRAITPSDSVDLVPGCRAIYTGTGGDISIVDLSGNTVVFVGTIAGYPLPVQAARVNASGTVATGLIALY